MKSITLTTDMAGGSSVQFIFLYGRFIVFQDDRKRFDAMVKASESIFELVFGYDIGIEGLYDNFNNIQLLIKDERDSKIIDYSRDKEGKLFKDGILVEIPSDSFAESETEVIFDEIVEILNNYREKWTVLTSYHYSFTLLKIFIYDSTGEYFTFNLTNWPVDDEFKFAMADYIFFIDDIDEESIGDIDFCTKENLLETIRIGLEKTGYLGILPTKIECMLFNEFIEKDGTISLDRISETDELSLEHNHNLQTAENPEEIKAELYPKCTNWIVEEIEYWQKDFFDEIPFNIAEELQKNLKYNPFYSNYENAESEEDLPEFIFPNANPELKAIVDNHIEEALKSVNTVQITEKLNDLNEYLEDADALFNPKFNLVLDKKLFFMRSYIEDGRAWTWVKDGEDLDSPYLYFKEINLDSNEKEKRRYQSILDYFIDKSEMA
jgi:hypothetical protein